MKEYFMNALSLSHYIIHKYDDITPMKLQKLLYYLKVWGLVSGTFSVDTEFKKWKYGPVSNEIFHEYKQYKSAVIPKAAIPFVELSSELKASIDFVLDCYSVYSAVTLSAMTHQEKPWQKTPDNAVITEKKILKYYSQQSFAKNFPFHPKNSFYPLQTDIQSAYIFDMGNEETEKMLMYQSYEEYLKHQLKAEKSISKIIKTLAA
jgi:uncharacterized phage-associated protein